MHEASRVEPQANGGRVFVVIVIPFKSKRWGSTKTCRLWYSLISYGDIGKFIKNCIESKFAEKKKETSNQMKAKG